MDRSADKNLIRLEGIDYRTGNIQNYTDKISQTEWGKTLALFINEWLDASEYISVQTSGSTGSPKRIRLPKKMMIESAMATGRFLGLNPGDKALLCLPVQFIAGKMMVVRAFTLGLDLYCQEPTSAPEISQPYAFSAMTPHQVTSLLEIKKEKLNRISQLIIGGGSLEHCISEQLQSINTQYFLSYGMTETSSHIALQKINGQGISDSFELIDKHISLISGPDGRLSITGGFLGKEIIHTNDIIHITGEKTFQWLGRADFVINTGGIKVHPEALENKIRELIPVAFLITGIPDPLYQQRIVLVVEPGIKQPEQLYEKIISRVLPHEKPVKIFEVNALPKTENGKIIRKINIENNGKLIWEKKL